MVAVSSLTYRYGAGKTLSFPDFSLTSGEACLLLGNSGSGKTTLLHLMGGLLKIQKGTIRVENVDLSQLSGSKADQFRGRHMGFIFQRNHLISALTVKKNLLMAPFLANIGQDVSRVEEALTQLGVWEKRNARIHQLSQGEAQRVAIARAMLNRPAVVFADEPTSALDDENCDRVIRLLMDLSQKNRCTLVVATHDQRLRSAISRQVKIEND